MPYVAFALEGIVELTAAVRLSVPVVMLTVPASITLPVVRLLAASVSVAVDGMLMMPSRWML